MGEQEQTYREFIVDHNYLPQVYEQSTEIQRNDESLLHCTVKETGERVFVKKIRIFNSPQMLERLNGLLRAYKEGVIFAREIFISGHAGRTAFLNLELQLYIVQDEKLNPDGERMTLKELLSKNHGWGYMKRQRLFHSIVFAIESLHSLGVCHWSLSPRHIILQSEEVYLLPFSLRKNKLVGDSVWYSPPESSFCDTWGDLEQGIATDVWSLGCIFVELFLTATPLLKSVDNDEKLIRAFEIFGIPARDDLPYLSDERYEEIREFLQQHFKGSEFPLFNKLFNGLSNTEAQLLKRMLHYNPQFRPNCNEVVMISSGKMNSAAASITSGFGHQLYSPIDSSRNQSISIMSESKPSQNIHRLDGSFYRMDNSKLNTSIRTLPGGFHRLNEKSFTVQDQFDSKSPHNRSTGAIPKPNSGYFSSTNASPINPHRIIRPVHSTDPSKNYIQEKKFGQNSAWSQETSMFLPKEHNDLLTRDNSVPRLDLSESMTDGDQSQIARSLSSQTLQYRGQGMLKGQGQNMRCPIPRSTYGGNRGRSIHSTLDGLDQGSQDGLVERERETPLSVQGSATKGSGNMLNQSGMGLSMMSSHPATSDLEFVQPDQRSEPLRPEPQFGSRSQFLFNGAGQCQHQPMNLDNELEVTIESIKNINLDLGNHSTANCHLVVQYDISGFGQASDGSTEVVSKRTPVSQLRKINWKSLVKIDSVAFTKLHKRAPFPINFGVVLDFGEYSTGCNLDQHLGVLEIDCTMLFVRDASNSPTIDGWFHIYDKDRRVIGQTKIFVTTRSNLSLQSREASFYGKENSFDNKENHRHTPSTSFLKEYNEKPKNSIFGKSLDNGYDGGQNLPSYRKHLSSYSNTTKQEDYHPTSSNVFKVISNEMDALNENLKKREKKIKTRETQNSEGAVSNQEFQSAMSHLRQLLLSDD
mmetsp:Transcript_64362/g.73885  ORF Transcript_64362/g.73885 Transcript_64362/m.73885 type:complete len:922 (+) Transcript_64362:94-2859(+)